MTTKKTDKRKHGDYEAHSRAADLAREGAHPYVHYLGLRSYKTAALLKRISVLEIVKIDFGRESNMSSKNKE